MSGSSPIKRDEMGMIYLGMIALVACWLVFMWYANHADIVYQASKWVWYQLALFDRPFMPSAIHRWRQEATTLAANPAVVSFQQLVEVMNNAGYLFVWIPILMSIRGITLAVQHRANRTRRKVTVDTLPWIMSAHAPAVIPVLHYGDLLNGDPEDHRSALSPDEWVQQHSLLINGVLDRKRCGELLIADLGSPVTTLEALQPHEKALFAVFGARLLSDGGDHRKAQELLDALNRSCHTHTWKGKKGYPDLTLASKLFARYANHPDGKQWLQKHPYPRTLLHAMHKAALASGKLPSSSFRWLKGMDRLLWYALNTTGRKAPFVESAAVYTQTLWEDFAFENGFRLTEPFIDDAINGVEAYLNKIGLMAPRKE